MRTVVTLLLGVLAVTHAFAIDSDVAFDDPELQARYEALIAEVRCLKCQNQSIKDSNVFLAADLRREIRTLMSDGKTDAEIKDFLVERYGDFALYRPRAKGKTLVLWVVPVIFFLLGSVAFVRVLRHRMAMPQDEDNSESAE